LIRKHRTALIAAAAFNFVLFFPTLFLGRVVSPNDVFYNYDPWTLIPHERVQNSLLNDPPTSLLTQVVMLKRGEAFHWDPYVGSGIPGAGWAALISPFILLSTFCVPIAWFYTALLFLKLNVAFFFAYLWLREERLGKRGAAIGALIFAGAGVYAVRWMWQATNATALYPALLWLVARIFHGKRNSIAFMALIALSYALAGFPSTMSYGAYLAVAYAIFLLIRERRFPVLRLGEGILAVLIGLAIAAPSLAAFAGFVKRTGYLGARANLSTTVFFPLSHLAMFLHPNLLGNNAYKDWIGNPALGMLNNYYEATVYLGLITIPLVLLAFANRRPRSRWFWIATTLVILGAMFGFMPVVAVLGRLPGFRYTPLARCVMLLPVCAGYLSGAGAQWLTRWRFRNTIAAAIVLLAAWDLGLFAGRFYPYLEPAKTNVAVETSTIAYLRAQPKPFRIAPFFIDLWPNSSELFQLEDIRSHFSSEAIYRRMLQRVDPTSWSGSSTVITFNSLNFNFDDPIVGMLGVRYFVENKDIDIIKWSTFKRTVPGVKESGAFRMKPGMVVQRVVHVDQEPVYALELPIAAEQSFGSKPNVDVQLLNYGAVVWERLYTPEEIGVLEKVYVPIRPYARKGDSLTLRIQTNGVQARFLQSVASSDGYPIFYGRVTTPVIFDRELPDGRLFLNLAEVPRFRAAKHVVSLTPEQFLARRDIDLSDTAVVTDGQTAATGGDASISLTRYAPDEQRITTDAPAPFLLASSEKLTPELAISIDAKRAKPIEIDALFAAIEVPAGQHRVVFSRVIGRGWWWATIVGAIAFAAIALVQIIAALRR
jgi:hypothetical protein